MRNKEIKLPLTPITEETFERQGWKKVDVNEPLFEEEDFLDEMDEDFEDAEEPIENQREEPQAFYYILSIPKDRTDPYCPKLISNATDENGLLKEMGLEPGTFFVELMDWDGLGYCETEEDIEILYKALTGKDLEN